MVENEMTAGSSQIKVLIIEGSPQDGDSLRQMLTEPSNNRFEPVNAGRLAEGLRCLREDSFDVILLNLLLPDGTGLEAFVKAHSEAADVPIIVITDLNSEALGVKAVREGAQDYLIKGEVDGKLLARSIRYAIERHRMQAALRGMLLIDNLTGLYNRRGFLTVADQHLKLARRKEKEMLLLLAELENHKIISDKFGHDEGDRALLETAEILKNTFRSSDLIALVGDDEFAVLAIETTKSNSDIIIKRLLDNLNDYNLKESRYYRLSLGIAIACYGPKCQHTVEELLDETNKIIYTEWLKRKRAVN